ncbi:MAG: pseudouridine synthase [Anaerolineales bacterium]
MKNRLGKLLEVVIFIFPALILLLIFVIIPAVETLSLAFLNAEGDFVGLQNFSEKLRPGLVHRLDKDTSGCIIVAKNETAHKKLSQQFMTRNIKKLIC